MISKLRLFFLFFALGPGFLHAQTTPSAYTENSGVRFRLLGWQVNVNGLFYELAGKDAPIQIDDSVRSPFYSHAKADRITFYRIAPPISKDEKPRRETVAVAEIASAGPWPLLVFFKSAASTDQLKVVAIPDDLKSFPAPSCRFINLTPVELQIRFGDQNSAVAPRSMWQFDPRLTKPDQSEARFTAIAVQSPQGPHVLYSNNWAIRPSQRTLVFVFTEQDGMQVHRILDDVTAYETPASRPSQR